MTTIVTRAGKGAPLVATEHDANLTNLNNDKVEKTRAINTALPLTGGGQLTGDLSLGINAASDTAVGVIELATAAESAALADLTRAVTPGTLPLTSETQRGLIELATAAEAAALTDLVRALTPGTLPLASETQRGAVELATAAETTTGTSSAVAVHPAGLKVELDKKALLAGNSAQVFAVAPATVATQAPQIQQVTHENGIVNGALLVWQDGTSFVGLANGTYIADNFKYNKTGSMVHDAVRVAESTSTAAPGMVFDRARLTLTTAQASMAAGDYCALRTYIEGYQWRRYMPDQCTLQFLVKLPLAGTYCYSIQNSAQDYSYVGEFAYTTANTDQLITVTVPAPSAGTWLFDSGIGAQLSIVLASGTTFGNGVVGWQAGNKLATANQVNSLNVATTSTYELALIRIDAGPVARPWSARDIDYGSTFIKCARYYEKHLSTGTAGANTPVVAGYAAAGVDIHVNIPYAAPKRAAPSASIIGTWSVSNCGQPVVNQVSKAGMFLSATATATGNLYAYPTAVNTGYSINARY